MSIKSKLIAVRFTPEQEQVLNDIVKFESLQTPMWPPTLSDIVRQLVIERGKEVERYRCPQCDTFCIPDEERPGGWFCGVCAQTVLYFGNGSE